MKSSIKVAMLAQNYLPHLGGAERQIAALAPLLVERGVELSIITRQCDGARYSVGEDAYAKLYRSPVPASRALASMLFTAIALYRLRTIRPDVIHVHELLSPATAGVAASKMFKIPVVAKVLRGGTLGDIDKISSRRFGSSRMRLLGSGIDRFLAISDEIERELVEQGVDPDRVVALGNGVDTATFKPADSQTKAELRQHLDLPPGPLAIFCGRMSAEKNLDLLVSVWPQIREQHPQANLLLVGEGPERDKLAADAAGVGVTLQPAAAEVSSLLRASDVFVLPSSTEGMSNALLEAMACGLTCVATKVGAAPQMIAHGSSGMLCDAGAKDQLAAALDTALRDNGNMGLQARAKVIANYSLENTADRLVELYRELSSCQIPT